MNSSTPDQAPIPEKQKPGPQLGANGEPQSLPVDDRIPPGGLKDPDEKMKRIEREGEINKVAPEPETHTGVSTTGVGQPAAQAVHQGQSLPQAALPVEKKFEGKAEQFYDPMDAERAVHRKDSSARGATKTPE
jgi:hypothetical protein